MARPDVKITIAGDASSLDKATKQAGMSLDAFNKKAEKTAREASAAFDKMQAQSGKGKAFSELEGQLSNLADNVLPGSGAAVEHFASKMGGAQAAVMTLGPALGALAVTAKGVGDFNELAQSVLTFQRIAGTTAEESSRWVEVLGDYNVSAEQGAAVVGKFAKVIGTTPSKLREFGVEVKKNHDGTVDLNGTLMAAADVFASTTDETKKAALGTALFGKSWQDMVPILEQGSAGIKSALDSVSQGKILDQEDLTTAEDFRLAIDSLKDTLESLSVTIGKQATPALKEFAQVAGAIGGATDNTLTRPVMKAGKAFMDVMNPIHSAKRAMEEWNKATTEAKDSEALANFVTSDLAPGMKLAAAATEAAGTSTEMWTQTLHANMRAKTDAAEVTQVLAEKEEDNKAAVKASERALEDLTNAHKRAANVRKDAVDAVRAETDKEFAFARAQRETKQATEDLSKAKRDHGKASTEAAEAGDELKQSILDQAKAYSEQRGAVAGTQSDIDAQKAKLTELRDQYAKKFPEIAAFIQTYIDKLNEAAVASTRVQVPGYEGNVQSGGVTRRASYGAAAPGQTWAEQMGGGGHVTINVTALDPKGVLDVLANCARINGGAQIRKALGLPA